ncbi:MAG: D-glycero-beta-D-manno-heptose-7-phosphate kinase [Rhodospirillales bacterium]
MTERAALMPLVEALGNARVLCIGDVMLDRYVHGRVERISPEAPIPVLSVEREATMLGGAGNVVRNLLALGATGRFISVVGADPAADDLRALLADERNIGFALITEPGRRTSIKTRYLAGNQQIVRADWETVEPLSEAAHAAVFRAATEMLPECSVMVLSDYGKGVFGNGLVGRLIAAAHAAGKKVIVDPKGNGYQRYRGADVITPNRYELAQAVNATIVEGQEGTHARDLIATYDFGAVLATLGEDGMLLVTAAGDVRPLPAEAREVFDVSGAGDTVVATVAAALAIGAPLERAAALANVTAGIVVGKVGTATVYASEVAQELLHHDLSKVEAKAMVLEAARDRVERWRRRGLRIGFTNGCFDLLHPGHVSLLNQAKEACDRLVVGLNNDASVARLKGPGRPIQSEVARTTVLASLSTVDLVVVFGEDTPIRVIEKLRPDVLVKGADYRLDEVVGADVVQGYGGRVMLARLQPGYSTTATLSRITT